jgi:hypothetical protein
MCHSCHKRQENEEEEEEEWPISSEIRGRQF